MALPSLFEKNVADQFIQRVQQLTPQTQAQWGKMNVAQMLAHCNVAYEFTYEEENHKKPSGFKKFILTLLVKPTVVSEKTYPKNSRTAPEFIISDERVFETEKNRLINFIQKAQQDGANFFEGRESNSFGKLKSIEWNNMFYKHLNHHLEQFGV